MDLTQQILSMYFRCVNFSPRFFNLSIFFLLLMGFSQCISREDEPKAVESTVQDLVEELKNLPKVEDVDPLIDEPDYSILLGTNLSLEKLEEISKTTAEGELSVSALELLEKLMAGIDPGVRSLLGEVTPEYLLELMDPKNGLDPETQELLEKMLIMADLHLPQIKTIEGLIDIEILKERIDGVKTGSGGESLRTAASNSECAVDVYYRFGSGARGCAFREQEELGTIEFNYNQRMDAAEQRYLQRNVLIESLYTNRLMIKASLLANLGKAIQSIDDPAEQERVKMQVKYLGLLYATYIRMHLKSIYEGGLSINHLYFQREVELITDQRQKMEEEIRENFRDCLEQVNRGIIEETEANCPGEEPYLY